MATVIAFCRLLLVLGHTVTRPLLHYVTFKKHPEAICGPLTNLKANGWISRWIINLLHPLRLDDSPDPVNQTKRDGFSSRT